MREGAEYIYWLTAASIVLIAMLNLLQICITRRSLLFGVRIPEEHTSDPEVVRLKRKFICYSLIAGALILILYLLLARISYEWLIWSSILIYLSFIFVSFFVVYLCWRDALKLKTEKGWLTPFLATAPLGGTGKQGSKLALPWIWFIISFCLAVFLIALSLIVYPALPDQIPTHFDLNMQPDAWRVKNLGVVMLLPLIIIGMSLLDLMVIKMVYRQKMTVDYAEPARSYAQHRIYRCRMGHLIGAINLSLAILLSTIQLTTIGFFDWELSRLLMWGMTGLVLLVTAIMVVAQVKMGQSGNRLNPPVELMDYVAVKYFKAEQAELTPAQKQLFSQRNDDRLWKLGMFYYNPDDTKLLIENRFGSNTGFNFGRRSAWVIATLLALFVVGTLVGTALIILKI